MNKNERNLRRYINKIIRDFEKHVRADEMKGAAPPSERCIINLEYLLAKQRLFNILYDYNMRIETDP